MYLLDEFGWAVRAFVGLLSSVSHLVSPNLTWISELLVTVGTWMAEISPVPFLVSPQGVGGGVMLCTILTLVQTWGVRNFPNSLLLSINFH